VRRRTTEN